MKENYSKWYKNLHNISGIEKYYFYNLAVRDIVGITADFKTTLFFKWMYDYRVNSHYNKYVVVK